MKEALDCRVQFQNLLAIASYRCSETRAIFKKVQHSITARIEKLSFKI